MKISNLYKEQFKPLKKKIDVGSYFPSDEIFNQYVVLGFEEDENYNIWVYLVYRLDFTQETFSENLVIKKPVTDAGYKSEKRFLKKGTSVKIPADEIYTWMGGKRYKSRADFELENSKYELMPHKMIEEPFFRHLIEILYLVASLGIIFSGKSREFDWVSIISCLVLNTLFVGYLLLCNIYYLTEAKKNTSEKTSEKSSVNT